MIAVPSRTKEILEKYDLRAKKGFGQNFLVDPVIVTRCAEQSHSEGAVIEIGPGLGALTEALARVSKHVTCYEVDEDMVEVLKDTLNAYDNVEVILQDFLEADLHEKTKALKEAYGSISVCATLPYYITTPVLFKIFEEGDIPWITAMVQKEVGDRFAAAPGSAEYSALSVEGQYLYSIRKLFTVPGRSFNPSPAVDSIILQFARRGNLDPSVNTADFFALVRASFQQRRKTIYNNLRTYFDDAEKASDVLRRAGIEPSHRAQELSVDDLMKIYRESL